MLQALSGMASIQGGNGEAGQKWSARWLPTR